VKGLLLLLLLSPTLTSASNLVDIPDLGHFLKPNSSEWPVELVKIHKENYPTNSEASFCIRPAEMVDTIVLHHSQTSPQTSAMKINEMHLERGSAADPWYMIAYNYVVQAPYPGGRFPSAKVTEGRPIEIVGAHAGSSAFVQMNNHQLSLWNEKKILCGKEGQEGQVDLKIFKNDYIKANVTTLGVVLTGNYAPFSPLNPGGYSRRSPRYPTQSTQELLGKLSCQLQKKYPRIKYIKWHNYYSPTSCPGTLKNFISQIRAHAKRYGCEFQ
jgi:hypothetical protein